MSDSMLFNKIYSAMLWDGIIFDTCPSSQELAQNQWGSVDLNRGSFYFRITYRDQIAKLLEPSGYETTFLSTKCHADEINARLVHFWAYNGDITLKDFNIGDR